MLEQFPDIGAPDWGLGTETEADVAKIKLGDGYELRQPNGMNHLTDTWSPSWSSLTPSTATTAHDWLRERLNWKAFSWFHPVSNQLVNVVCTSARVTYDNYGNAVLSATFKQDHNPE